MTSEPYVPVNEVSVAANDVYVVGKNAKLTVGGSGVLANDLDPDGDALAAGLVSGTSKGTLNLKADGSFTYTPFKNFIGTDSFTYKAVDETGALDLATVTISVTGSAGGGGRGKGKGNGKNIFEDQIPAPTAWEGITGGAIAQNELFSMLTSPSLVGWNNWDCPLRWIISLSSRRSPTWQDVRLPPRMF